MEWDVECIVGTLEWHGMWSVLWWQWNGVGCGGYCGNSGIEWDVESVLLGRGVGGGKEWDVECIIEAVEQSGMWHDGTKLGGI